MARRPTRTTPTATQRTATTTPITVGAFPTGLAINPQGTRVYAINSGVSSMSVIDTATNTIIGTLDVGTSLALAVTPDGTRIYTTNVNTVSVITFGAVNLAPTAAPTFSAPDASTGVVTGNLNATDPEGSPLTYTVTAAPAGGRVTVTATGAFTYTPTHAFRLLAAEAPGLTDSFDVTISDGVRITITTVDAVPVAPGQLTLNPTPLTVGPAGTRINGIAFSPDGTRAYAAVNRPNDPGDGPADCRHHRGVCLRSDRPHSATNVLQQQNEVELVGRAQVELRDEMKVEVARVSGLSMNE